MPPRQVTLFVPARRAAPVGVAGALEKGGAVAIGASEAIEGTIGATAVVESAGITAAAEPPPVLELPPLLPVWKLPELEPAWRLPLLARKRQ